MPLVQARWKSATHGRPASASTPSRATRRAPAQVRTECAALAHRACVRTLRVACAPIAREQAHRKTTRESGEGWLPRLRALLRLPRPEGVQGPHPALLRANELQTLELHLGVQGEAPTAAAHASAADAAGVHRWSAHGAALRPGTRIPQRDAPRRQAQRAGGLFCRALVALCGAGAKTMHVCVRLIRSGRRQGERTFGIFLAVHSHRSPRRPAGSPAPTSSQGSRGQQVACAQERNQPQR